MWWTTDNRVQRQPTRFVESIPPQKLLQALPARKAQKRRHLKLPISADQAAANLRLQESGADCNAEVPRLRKDIRSLESALLKVVSQADAAKCSIDSLQRENHQQLEKIDQLEAELRTLHAENEHKQRRKREEGEWLTISADLANSLGRRIAKQEHDAEQHISELKEAVKQLSSDNRNLNNLLELASQENRIFSDVICDMESRQESELHEAHEQLRLLKNRLSQDGAADRSQVQQLNIRIVSQAAQIRSLQKQLADAQSSELSHENGYETILDDQPMSENAPRTDLDTDLDTQLNERLENSLQAARVELDSAVHELKYANAEANRLREYAEQVEQQYDSEFHHVVQVAELHATLAEMLEQSRESVGIAAQSQVESLREEQLPNAQKSLDDLVAQNHELTDALKEAEKIQKSNALTSEKIESQTQEMRDLNHELAKLRESQATLSGENETLSAFNQDLERRLAGLTHQLSETEQARSDDKAEWEKLSAHHEAGTNVAHAECQLVKSQLEDQRVGFEFKLKQQLEVIKCLHADVGAARGLQSQLESKLDGEILNRQLAEQEIKQVKQEAARTIESLSAVSEQLMADPNEVRDEPGDESSMQAAA
ncbi:MAG: hypothetical protein ACR2N1_17740 [Rubripirellula sp.]